MIGFATVGGQRGTTHSASRVLRWLAAAVLATALLAEPSFAAQTRITRDLYIEKVEPICKEATLANQNTLKGVEKMVREGELNKAAPRFVRAAGVLEGTVERLAAVPRPPADVKRLAAWLSHGKGGAGLLGRIGERLQEGRRSSAETMAGRLLKETKQANAVVVGFDFDYCRLNPARFV